MCLMISVIAQKNASRFTDSTSLIAKRRPSRQISSLLQQLQRRRENNFLPFGIGFGGWMQAVFCDQRFVLAHFFAERENIYNFQAALSRFFSHDLIKAKNSFVNVATARIFPTGRSNSEVRDGYYE